MKGSSPTTALGSCWEGLVITVLCLVICLFVYLFIYVLLQYASTLLQPLALTTLSIIKP